jgi:manganese oxidase
MKTLARTLVARLVGLIGLLGLGFAPVLKGEAAQGPPGDSSKCRRIVHADVVALDHGIAANRYGSFAPDGMLFALKRDVVPNAPGAGLAPGQVTLRPGKRPRPIVLRANVGDCLEITLTNLLDGNATVDNVTTRAVSLNVAGLEWVDSVADDGSWVGQNASSLAMAPGNSRTYRLYARAEGAFLLFSQGADFGQGAGSSGQVMKGLFGMVIVEPADSLWFRSQVTREVLDSAQEKGKTGPHGHPVINYHAVDDKGDPILAMLKPRPVAPGPPGFDLIASDLTAIITGADSGPDPWHFPRDGGDEKNYVYPHRERPYREFAIHYHDAFNIQAAFKYGGSSTSPLSNAISPGSEAFAINYGSVGITTEVWANRIGVGPMKHAVEAKFEEFFLSSWTCGDPAVLVDNPANTPVPATKALFPDDPSNVYHSYLNDRVKFRVIHAGSNVVHVHHQHAHQWLKTPKSNESKLLDSQTITPGEGFTLEMIYGSGNRNLTAGDSIFHCHFYPHFAAGLWAMWRVHDVYEAGTELGSDGRPVSGARALPDGEIPEGTPIPGLVPMPVLAMAPIPPPVKLVPTLGPINPGQGGTPVIGYHAELVNPVADRDRNPGYPFFIPGEAGHRAPQPPMDFAIEDGQALDGGLPRHIVLSGTVAYEQHNALDFTKENVTRGPDGQVIQGHLDARALPKDGTETERAAMAYHSRGKHPSSFPDGTPATFRTNGGKSEPGAPYANPAADPWADQPDPNPKQKVVYKAADIQFDVVFNKKGWHYPQQRILSLWGDVKDVMEGRRAPEPLFFRANSTDVIEYWLANLIPSYYELDDFQVRTPTDIIGQHIHLVKFDVTSSDGAVNGFNYEDGSFSPQEVRDRIDAINAGGGIAEAGSTTKTKLKARTIPFFGDGPNRDWVGAQATVQRWYADRLLDIQEPKPRKKPGYRAGGSKPEDRTLQSVFTHDHFSPSTHQQVGLYAALIVEPEQTNWLDVATGQPMGGRDAPAFAPGGPSTRDGGPTSWQALIVPTVSGRDDQASREFVLEFQDFQLAYQPGSVTKPVPYARYPQGSAPPAAGWGWVDAANAIAAPQVNGGPVGPTIISTPPDPGSRSLNYRSEPIPFRVAQAGAPTAPIPANLDLAHVFRSIERDDLALNVQPTGPIAKNSPFQFPGGFAGAGPFDPYTPLLRAYEDDRVQIRVLVGAHHDGHVFNVHGINWLAEPSYLDSGYRDNQTMSISEHFEMNFVVPPASGTDPARPSDYLYLASGDTDGTANGLWGLLRAYRSLTPGLQPLPGNSPSGTSRHAREVAALYRNEGTVSRPVRTYDVSAVVARLVSRDPVPQFGLVLNATPGQTTCDPDALIYVRTDDLGLDGKLKPGIEPGPLVLRANAGDLIRVTLRNKIAPTDSSGKLLSPFAVQRPFQGAPAAFDSASGLLGATSPTVGLHPGLVAFDVTQGDGSNAGANPVQTVPPGGKVTYTWFAGVLGLGDQGSIEPIPVEFGAVNLAPADPSFQHTHGLLGVLIVEPEGSTWADSDRAVATITPTRPIGGMGPVPPPFREFVVVAQDQVDAVQVASGTSTPVSGLKAVNYKTEPMSSRFSAPPKGSFDNIDIAAATSDSIAPHPVLGPTGATGVDPQTPVYVAAAGMPTRFRVLHPGGNSYSAWTVHGHVWQRSPYVAESTVLAPNVHSDWIGAVGAFGPLDTFNVLLDSAGGRFAVPGDYLYRSVLSAEFQSGQWGVFRVVPPGQDAVSLRELVQGNAPPAGLIPLTIRGRLQRASESEPFAPTVAVLDGNQTLKVGSVDPTTGEFAIEVNPAGSTTSLVVKSPRGGLATITLPRSPTGVAAAPIVRAPGGPVRERSAQEKRAESFVRRKPPIR